MEKLRTVIDRFHQKSIPVSLFVYPDRAQIDASKEIGADMIELHTGDYSEATEQDRAKVLLQDLRAAAEYGKRLGLGINAGHGLNYANVVPVTQIDAIEEMSIGHSIISRGMFVGLEQAVREMKVLLQRAR